MNLINNVQRSVDGMIDIPIAKDWAIELGVNYVFDSGVFAPQKGESYKGFKWRPALKYYLDRTETVDFYLAIALKYNDIKNSRYVDVIRQGGQYTETLLQQDHLRTWGVALRTGAQFYPGLKKRFIMEPFFALGWRQRKVTQDKPFPADAELIRDRSFISNRREPGITSTPDMMMGLSLGWKLSSRR